MAVETSMRSTFTSTRTSLMRSGNSMINGKRNSTDQGVNLDITRAIRCLAWNLAIIWVIGKLAQPPQKD